jgi:hypothetical protein
MVNATTSRAVRAKIAHTVPEAALASGLSRSTLYIAIRQGVLRAKKCGTRTIILDTELRRFLRGLPHLVSAARASPKTLELTGAERVA